MKLTKLCTYHESDLLEIPLELEHLSFHFALVWTLSNFQNFLQMVKDKTSFYNFSEIRYFYSVKNEAQMRQLIFRSLFGEKKMDAKFASTNSLAIQPIRGLPLFGSIWQNILQIVPKNGLLICTSSLQVFVVLFKWVLQVNLITSLTYNLRLQMYKCILSVFISVLFV
jgi:hypothetical protein